MWILCNKSSQRALSRAGNAIQGINITWPYIWSFMMPLSVYNLLLSRFLAYPGFRHFPETSACT